MKSNEEWKQWGERDPLYAVATWEGKSRDGAHPWTDSEFYALGESDWADFQYQWQHYGVALGTCVEIGCGAGRITKQLAGVFSQVVALDVSQHQLDYARSRIPESNIEFKLSNGSQVPVADQSCDAAFSVHVFQHFESHQDAYGVFEELYRALKPGGSIMIHLPMYTLPDMRVAKLVAPVFDLAKRYNDFKAVVQRWKMRRGQWSGLMKHLRYDRRILTARLQQIGFTKIESRGFATKSNGSFHEFVFATKKAA